MLTALSIGTWDWEVPADRIRGDAVLARMLGHGADDMARGMPMARFTAKFHPDDFEAGEARRARMREAGELFVWEHRVVPAPGVVRWVLARGHLERDVGGRLMRVRGICIDMTDCRTDGDVEGQIHLTAGGCGTGSPLDRAAERALELWDALAALDPAASGDLRPLVQALLLRLGKHIAASLRVSPRPVDPGLH